MPGWLCIIKTNFLQLLLLIYMYSRAQAIEKGWCYRGDHTLFMPISEFAFWEIFIILSGNVIKKWQKIII